jgi:hypothetical protein
MCSAWSETREGALLTMRHHQAGSRSLSLAPLWERVDRRRAAKRRRDGCGIAESPDVTAPHATRKDASHPLPQEDKEEV